MSEFDWAAHIEAVTADIFGEPNENMSRPPDDVRFGNKGSVSVNYTTGEWYDHENEHGGGVKELIRVHKEIADRDAAVAYAVECQQHFENGGKPRPSNGEKPRPSNGSGGQPLQREVEATYTYHDAAGQVAFEVVRFVYKQADGNYATNAHGKHTKTFSQCRPSGESDQSWLWKLGAGEFMRHAPGKSWIKFNPAKFEQYPDTRQRKVFNNAAPVVPYQLPDLLKAVAAGQTICIAEGEKKVDLIRSFGFPATCCAGGAEKWGPEHSAYLNGADVVLLPDNDAAGRKHIDVITTSLRAKRIRILELPDLPEKGDVDDWHEAGGTTEEFARLVAEAPDYVPDEPAGPQPLMRPLPPAEPFPLKSLGPELADAAQAICDMVQSPIEMCVGAVLASTSFAVSAHVDIRLPTGELKPVSVWIWCIAVSGERKNYTDNWAFAAQKQHERQLQAHRKVELESFDVRHRMWKAQVTAIEKQFKNPGEAGSDAHRIELEKIGTEPEKPLETLLMSIDFTIEGLENSLHIGQPLYGIIGAEGGQFIGGHGMDVKAKKRTIGGLCESWDGEPIKRARSNEITFLYGRRVGMHLMVQPEVAAAALGDELLAKQGFLARILMCAPTSLIGTRMHKAPPPEARQILQHYKSRLLDITQTPYPLAPDTRNELEPREAPFSAEATALFWAFSDEVEKQMAPGGEYESIQALASKLAQHAARIGATLAAYRDLRFTELNYDDLLHGIQIATWYATEAKRLAGTNTVNSELWPEQKLPPAQKLLDWLWREWKKPTVSAREIYTYGPNSIRNRKRAVELAEILVEHEHLIALQSRHKKWQIAKGPDR